MSSVEFVKPTQEMIEHIAATMRKADAAEVWASGHHTPLEALQLGLSRPGYATCGVIDGEPCSIFGVTFHDMLSGIGIPWLLSSESVTKHRAVLLNDSKPVVQQMIDLCPKLFNYVHTENKMSIRWLKMLGFTMDPPASYGKAGEMFHRFHMIRSDINV